MWIRTARKTGFRQLRVKVAVKPTFKAIRKESAGDYLIAELLEVRPGSNAGTGGWPQGTQSVHSQR
jgi:hypothetical protein